MFALLAALVVLAHLLFVVFAALGGLLVMRRPKLAWLHLPAAAWAVVIEVAGGICPLTPLENALRSRAGLEPYTGDFIAQYVFPVLYPQGLTREIQIAIGIVVLALNLGVYGWMLWRRRPAAGAPVSGR